MDGEKSVVLTFSLSQLDVIHLSMSGAHVKLQLQWHVEVATGLADYLKSLFPVSHVGRPHRRGQNSSYLQGTSGGPCPLTLITMGLPMGLNFEADVFPVQMPFLSLYHQHQSTEGTA